MKVKLTTTPANVLVFDIENRPLSYWYDGNPTAEVTLIASKWLGAYPVDVFSMRRGGNRRILQQFRHLYEEADVVVGHNIRRHDLPILNGAYIEQGLQPLSPKLTVDTLRDLVGWKDIPKSLEYLCDWLDCPVPKFHMTQHSWRKANRLEDSGMLLAAERVEDDVRATEWVYLELLKRGLLKGGPRMWKP